MPITARIAEVETLRGTMTNNSLQGKVTSPEVIPVSSMGGSSVRVVDISLYANAWEGSASPYSQVVHIEDVTEYSKVDLQPSVEQLDIFHDKDIAFSAENDGGVVTVYAVGDKPTLDYTMQATVTEVVV